MGEIGGHLVRLRTVVKFFMVALLLIIGDDTASSAFPVDITLIFVCWISFNYILIDAIFRASTPSVLVCFTARKNRFLNDERRETLFLLHSVGRALVKLAHCGRSNWRQLAIR